jgi:uncharacterized phage protein (TIGR02218 family)
MLRIDLVDGSTLAFTDHNRTLSFDLGDGAVDYSPGTGILPSDLSLSAGFDADDMEVSGPIGDVVTRTQVLGGRFDDATIRYFWVNWDSLADGPAKLLKGWVVQSVVEGGRFKLTCHSEMSRFSQSVGLIVSPYCRWDFGSTECGATPVTLAATVSAVTDALSFTVTFAGSFANDYWNKGTVNFDTGELSGIRPVEVFDWTSGGLITLLTPLPEPPLIGDTLTLRQGCGKTRADCIVLQGDAVQFGGFPDVPGTDKVLSYANPGG